MPFFLLKTSSSSSTSLIYLGLLTFYMRLLCRQPFNILGGDENLANLTKLKGSVCYHR